MTTSGLNMIIQNVTKLREQSWSYIQGFKSWVRLDSSNLSPGRQLAVKYFIVAVILFFAQILFGLLAATQFIVPGFLYEILDFSVNRMVHINAMVVWMLYGFIGCVYWLLEDESGTEIVGLKLGNIAFWVLTGAVTLVVLVYLLVQIGPGKDSSIWFINEGREYIEAPRWADIGIVVVMLIFSTMWRPLSVKVNGPVSQAC